MEFAGVYYVGESCVDQAVLFHEGFVFEFRRGDGDLQMHAVFAGRYFKFATRERFLEAFLHLMDEFVLNCLAHGVCK